MSAEQRRGRHCRAQGVGGAGVAARPQPQQQQSAPAVVGADLGADQQVGTLRNRGEGVRGDGAAAGVHAAAVEPAQQPALRRHETERGDAGMGGQKSLQALHRLLRRHRAVTVAQRRRGQLQQVVARVQAFGHHLRGLRRGLRGSLRHLRARLLPAAVFGPRPPDADQHQRQREQQQLPARQRQHVVERERGGDALCQGWVAGAHRVVGPAPKYAVQRRQPV